MAYSLITALIEGPEGAAAHTTSAKRFSIRLKTNSPLNVKIAMPTAEQAIAYPGGRGVRRRAQRKPSATQLSGLSQYRKVIQEGFPRSTDCAEYKIGETYINICTRNGTTCWMSR